MNYEKTFWTTFVILFIIFIVIYFSSTNGYYEHENMSKKVFTEEKIKEFEEDIKLGKKIDVKNYLSEEEKNYQNKVSKIGDSASNLITGSFTNVLEKSFKFLEKMLN